MSRLHTHHSRSQLLLLVCVLLSGLLLATFQVRAATASTLSTRQLHEVNHSTGARFYNDPLAGTSFWLNPEKPIVQEEELLRASHRFSDAARIEKIASQPQATWFTGPVTTAYVRSITKTAQAEGKVPVYVMYDLPWRGCDVPDGGGAPNPRGYRHLVNVVARGLKQASVVMVVEPDALSELSCLSRGQQREYYGLIKFALHRFEKDANAALYVDAGHPGYDPVDIISHRLMKVVAGTNAGFSLNVSNYVRTPLDIAYGTAISRATGGRHFIIDTSRNGGHVPMNLWCNPPGAKLGADPTSDTGNPLVDAELWIKGPGDSDGTCNGGPASGIWLKEALELTSR